MQKITPFLWFDGRAEEAMTFYTAIFKSAKCTDIMRYGPAGPGPEGSVMTVAFELEGQSFVGLNGGPHYSFTPAISFFVHCETQDEIDWYWERLGEGGKYIQCGWLCDKFGVSWQIVPGILMEMLRDKDPERSTRVMNAMLGMIKLDIAALKRAYA
jgi:predicted 3-demethylubiquinone-9 3-methyltransferase (glyoxalase superfamily)